MKDHKQKTKGFTLIELSIVLVIIGLVVSAVITGQALIDSARVTNAINQINSIKTSIHGFRAKYGKLPGDLDIATKFWPGETANGDGDEKWVDTDYDQFVDKEGGYIWQHLSLAKIYGSFEEPTGSTFSYNYGINSPEIFPGTAVIGANRDADPGANRYDSMGNYLQIAGWTTPGSQSTVRCATIPTLDTKIFDQKMDDGIPSSGRVLGYRTSTCTTYDPGVCTTYGSGADWALPNGADIDYDVMGEGHCRINFLFK